MFRFVEIVVCYLAHFWSRFKGLPREFDYFDLYVYDVNCIPRGRMVEKRRLQEIIRRGGLGTNAAICYIDLISQSWFGTKENPGNAYMRPDLKTLAKVPKTSVGEHRVAQITCDLVFGQEFLYRRTNIFKDFEPTSPRTVALRQLEKLRENGYKIHYCFEMELTLLRSKDGSVLDLESTWGNMVDSQKNEEMMIDFLEALNDANVFCATLHPEAGPSQFEFVLKMSQAIQGADMAARFRKEAKAFFEKKELFASFLSHNEAIDDKFCRTMHLNHYLSSFGKGNVFTNGPKRVSVLAWRWMAGIHRHLPALMALFCPTQNCYKRYTDDFVRKLEFFSLHQRNSCIRSKREGKETYLESRLPSSFSNPYLVLAGTIAAGLDGIKNYPWGGGQMDRFRMDTELPRNLQEALRKLEDDNYLKEELESTFVDMFIAMKRKELGQN